MTAEVAIANSNAVALAADSAVTIGQQKIYNSALKVFSLSKVAPVGVMVFGNAGLLSVPWETLIKQYRANLGSKRFDQLENYSEDFLAYIAASEYFPEKLQQRWVSGNLEGFCRDFILKEINQQVTTCMNADGQVDESTTKRIVKEVIKNHHDNLAQLDCIDGMNKAFENRIKRQMKEAIDSTIIAIFQSLPLTADLRRKLHSIAAFLHTRDIFSQGVSGLVIAGFGEKEIYPGIHTHQVEGVINGKIKCKYLSERSAKIADGEACAIVPFAQDDMVASFMKGMNPDVQAFMSNYLGHLLGRLPDLLGDDDLKGIKKRKTEIRQAYRDEVDTLFKTFIQDLNQHINENHISPVLSMVRVLPKDELAAMAESLVNLTAFKRRMTDSLETVGGPIDVAVISKGDGLVWVKRKHYFPAELNQHFFSNYFRGVKDE